MLKMTRFTIITIIFVCLMAMQSAAQEPAHPDSITGLDAPALIDISNHGNAFLHVTSVSDLSTHFTLLSHPLLNGNPDAIVFVTQRHWANQNPNYVGVWYHPREARWTIFNQNLASMTAGQGYVVQVLSQSESVFQVQAGQDYPFLEIDHPLLNGNPLAQLHVMPTNTYQGVTTEKYYDKPIGVSYSIFSDKWRIVVPNGTYIEADMAFNVQILSAASRNISFLHTTTAENTSGTYTSLEHQVLDSNQQAMLLVTPVINQYQTDAIYSVTPAIAVDYTADEWRIYHPDGNNMPVGTQFLVTILNSFYQTNTRVINAGFEVGAVGNIAVPHSWNAVGAAKRICNKLTKGKIAAYEQYCAAQVRGGNGVTHSLVQTLPPNSLGTFSSGEIAYIGARVTGKGVTSGARILAVIKMENGSKLKAKVPPADLLGTYGYKRVMGISNTTLSAAPTNIKVKILHSGTGALLVDAIYLSNTDLSDVLATPQNVGDPKSLIPLPQAVP